jgi:CDP-diacylglycerol--glycerol-3-phosphate 3-phosphatidyltransferase
MLRQVWTISTVLSFSRVILLAPLAYFLFSEIPEKRVWVAGVIAAAALTDFLDGYIARKLHQVTEFGKIIDPVADKVSVGAGALLLVYNGDVPLWYVGAVIVRDLLILSGGLYIKKKKNIISQSNWPGKIAVSLVALFLLLSALRLEALEGFRFVVLWLSVLVMIISLIVYVQRLFIGSAVSRRGSA